MGRILDVRGDIIETHHYDHSTGKSYIGTSQDVNPYLEQNQAEVKAESGNWAGNMHKVASIPMAVVEAWAVELGDNPLKPAHRAWFMAKIKDRDYSKLRTKSGNL